MITNVSAIELPPDSPELLVEFTYAMLRYVRQLPAFEDAETSRALEKLKTFLQRLSERAQIDLVSTAAEEIFGATEQKSKILAALLPSISIGITASAQQAFGNLVRYVDGAPYFAGEYLLVDPISQHWTPDYLCYLVKIEGQKAILEVIRDSLLASSGFPNFQTWESYLDSLHRQGVICLIDVAQLSNGNSFAVYKIPDGYQLLEEWFKFDGSPFRNLREYFEVILNINEAVEKTKRPSFFFGNVHSKFVACAGDRRVKLNAIGSALLVTSRFLSAYSNKLSPQNELGFARYSKFLGWLLFEMATQKCPIQETEHMQADPQTKYLSNSPLLDQYPSHVRVFLKRATHREEDFRYTDFAPISEEVTHIIDFLNQQDSPHIKSLPVADQQLLELVDYVALRFKAVLRNPKLNQMTRYESLDRRLQSVSADFTLFTRSTKNDISWLKDWMNHANGSKIKLPRRIWRWLSPTSKHLLKVAIVWSAALSHAQNIFQSDDSLLESGLVWLLILEKVLQLEALMCAQVIGRLSQTELGVTSEEIASVLRRSDKKIALTNPPNSSQVGDFRCTPNDIFSISKAIEKAHSAPDSFNAAETLRSLHSIAIFVAILSQSFTVFDATGNQILTTSGYHHVRTRSKSNFTSAHLSLALELMDFSECSEAAFLRNSHLNEEEFWYIFKNSLQAIYQAHRSNAVSRVRGVVTSYNYATYGSRRGKAKFRPIVNIVEETFTENELLEKRDISRSIAEGYPAQIDLARQGDPKIIGVMVRSFGLFSNLAPEKPNWKIEFVRKSDKNKHIIGLVLAVLASVISYAISQNFVSDLRISAIFACLSALLVNLISSVIYSNFIFYIQSSQPEK